LKKTAGHEDNYHGRRGHMDTGNGMRPQVISKMAQNDSVVQCTVQIVRQLDLHNCLHNLPAWHENIHEYEFG